jgi:hypothetical protein
MNCSKKSDFFGRVRCYGDFVFGFNNDIFTS